MDVQKVKVTNWTPVSMWFIGFLFTLGYTPFDMAMSWWEGTLHVGLTYIFWPILLGIAIAGV